MPTERQITTEPAGREARAQVAAIFERWLEEHYPGTAWVATGDKERVC